MVEDLHMISLVWPLCIYGSIVVYLNYNHKFYIAVYVWQVHKLCMYFSL